MARKFRKRPECSLSLLVITGFLLLEQVVEAQLASPTSCVAHQACATGRFCAQPPASRLPGTCENCWKSCLLPQVYGAAAFSRCRCRLGRGCQDDGECGPTEFCAVLRSRRDLPTCQPCTLCRNDSQSWQGSCAAACPSGSLDANGVAPEAAAHFVFLVFDIGAHTQARADLNINANGLVTMTEDALRLWLGDVPPHVLEKLLAGLPVQAASPSPVPSPPPLLLQAIDQPLHQKDGATSVILQHANDTAARQASSSRVLALGAVATRISEAWAHNPYCPAPPPELVPVAAGLPSPALLRANTIGAYSTIGSASSTGSNGNASGRGDTSLAAVVPKGCACNATDGAATFRCPAGHRCSPRAWLALPGEAVSLGSAALLKAECVACDLGNYCPEGTFVEEEEKEDRVLTELDCPAGDYCPGPQTKLHCPAGYFCPLRSIEPLTCDYLTLITDFPVLKSTRISDAAVTRELIRRLVKEREPLRGNYCPNGSVIPNKRCSGGYFCPTPAEEKPCPEGHYCRVASIAPRQCPPLTRCPEGSSAPDVRQAAVLTFLGFLVGVLILDAIVRVLDKSARPCTVREEDLDRQSRAERTLRDFVEYYNLNRGPLRVCLLNRGLRAVSPTASSPRSAFDFYKVKRHTLTVIDLSWKAMGRGERRIILENVRGTFRPGDLSAILGPSGCGKSTLLTLLGGRVAYWPPEKGKILLNRAEVTDPARLRPVAGFVPQDDVMCTDLTVRENLEYSAALRLPRPAGTRYRCWRIPKWPQMACTMAVEGVEQAFDVLRNCCTKSRACCDGVVVHPGTDDSDSSGVAEEAAVGANRSKLLDTNGSVAATGEGSRDPGAVGAGHDACEVNPGTVKLLLTPLDSVKGKDDTSWRFSSPDVHAPIKPISADRSSGATRVKQGYQLPGDFSAASLAGSQAASHPGAHGSAANPTLNTVATATTATSTSIITSTSTNIMTAAASVNAMSLPGPFLRDQISPESSPRRADQGRTAFKKELETVVDQVLGMMALKSLASERVGSSVGRSISGGQRKRVNIGMELVAQPAILLLDEPTSGLDASCSSDVLISLSELAWMHDVNVIAVLHQPRFSTFQMLDKVMLLGRTGTTVYHGRARYAKEYFEVELGFQFPQGENVADSLLDIVMGKIYNKECMAAELPERWTQYRAGVRTKKVAAFTAGAQAELVAGAAASLEPPQRPIMTAPPPQHQQPQPQPQPQSYGQWQGNDRPSWQYSLPDSGPVLSASGPHAPAALGPHGSIPYSELVGAAEPVSLSDTGAVVSYESGSTSTILSPIRPPDGEQKGATRGSASVQYGNALAGKSSTGKVRYRRPDLSEEFKVELTTAFTSVVSELRGSCDGGFNSSRENLDQEGLAVVFRKLGQEGDGAKALVCGVVQYVRDQLAFRRRQQEHQEWVAQQQQPGAQLSPLLTQKRPPPLQLPQSLDPPPPSPPPQPQPQSSGQQHEPTETRATKQKKIHGSPVPNLRQSQHRQSAGLLPQESSWWPFGSHSKVAPTGGRVPSSAAQSACSVDEEMIGQGPIRVTLEELIAALKLVQEQRLSWLPAGTDSEPQPVGGHSPIVSPTGLGAAMGGMKEVASTVLSAANAASRALGSVMSTLASPHRTSQPRRRCMPLHQERKSAHRRTNSMPAETWPKVKPMEVPWGDQGEVAKAPSESRVHLGPTIDNVSRRRVVSRPQTEFASGPLTSIPSGGPYPPGCVTLPGVIVSASSPSGPADTSQPLSLPLLSPSPLLNSPSSNNGLQHQQPKARGTSQTQLPVQTEVRQEGTATAGQPDDTSRLVDVAGSRGAPTTQAVPSSTASKPSPPKKCSKNISSTYPAPYGTMATPFASPEYNSLQPSCGVAVPPPAAAGPAAPDITSSSVIASGNSSNFTLTAASAASSGKGSRDIAVQGARRANTDNIGGGHPHGCTRMKRAATGKASRVLFPPIQEGTAVLGNAADGTTAVSNNGPVDPCRVQGGTDAAKRRQSSWGGQLVTFSQRAFRQSCRAFWPASVLEAAVHLAAAVAVGLNQGRNWDPTAVPGNVVMAMLVLAVLSVVQHLRTFSTNRAMQQRERDTGLSSTAFFVAKNLVDVPWILFAPSFFMVPYYVLTVPRASLSCYYAVSVGVWWWASGLAYLVTLVRLVPPAAAPTVAVLITLITGALLHGGGVPTLAKVRGTPLEGLLGVSYNRWALEALTISELDYYMDTHSNVIAMLYRDKGICSFDMSFKSDAAIVSLDDIQLSEALHIEDFSAFLRAAAEVGSRHCYRAWQIALIALFSVGTALRVLAALVLKYEIFIVVRYNKFRRQWSMLFERTKQGGKVAPRQADGRSSSVEPLQYAQT